METEDELFIRQCSEAGERIASVLITYPKPVAICVLPGVLASVMKTYGMPRDMVISMLDSALEYFGIV